MRSFHMYVFLTIFSLLLYGAHYYIYTRLAHYLNLSDPQKKALAFFFGIMILGIIGGMAVIRSLPREFSQPIAWVVYSWMGILLFLALSVFAVDAVNLITRPAQAQALADPERRAGLRRLFGFAALGAAGSMAVYSLWNALRPVQVKEVPITLKRLPPALNGLRLVQITDLHLGPTINGEWLRHVVEQVNQLDPDIVAITGDLVDGSVEKLGNFAAELRNLKSRHGVYFVTGNHEYYSGVDQWCAYLPGLGVRVLRNERVSLTINGAQLDLAGIDDYGSRSFPGHGPDLARALKDRDAKTPVILMAHQPVAVHEAAASGVDLQLSGHTHGGQIWPWNYLVLLQQPYIKGLHHHKDSDTQIYISEGTGYWGPPMRLGTIAEITHITLLSPAQIS